ncbi:MAG: hypothetical protein QOJ02_444 [Acidobacteriota bacterium]|jgi:hypothetical protein|nr:hypothetical protein [Acidobacteriota bacterium]
MKRKSTLVALIIGLTLLSIACSKSGTATNMSDDDKYKLVYAAAMTKDPAIMTDVAKKLQLVNSDGTPSDASKKFIEGGREWGQKNVAFAQEVNTPEKAKDYVKSHMP